MSQKKHKNMFWGKDQNKIEEKCHNATWSDEWKDIDDRTET